MISVSRVNRKENVAASHKFAGLDHLRALAITLVIIFHYRTFFPHPDWMDGFLNFGWSGVDLFFVLSGFLISNQLFAEQQKRNKISLRSFYIKRAFRILPPYLFILLIYIFIPAFHERERLPPLWKMFTFTQNFGLNIQTTGTFSHVWSLCVEEQFYLLFPLFLILFHLTAGMKRKAIWIIPVAFLVPLFIRWITWQFYLKPIQDRDDFWLNWYKWIYYPTYTRFEGLVVGIGAAAIYRFRNEWLIHVKRFANWILPIVFILFIISYFSAYTSHAGFSTIFGFSEIALVYGLLVLSAVLPNSFLFNFKSMLTRQLAILSYSLYLCHKGLIHLTQHWLQGSGIKEDGNCMFLICMAVCIAGAIFMRILIEKPFFYLRDKILFHIKS